MCRMLKWFLVIVSIAFLSNAIAQPQSIVQLPTDTELNQIIQNFQTYVIAAQKEWKIPGMAIAIIKENKVIYAKGFGVRKLGTDLKVNTKTIFEIGSMSKAFTAALVSMMIDEGNFTWDDQVVELYPKFKMNDPWVTQHFLVKDLMAQHSGLPKYAGDFQSVFGFSRDHIIHSLRYIKPVTSFRSEYAYQNSLFLVANKLVEQATGESWKTNIKQRIFKPLGMKDSSADSKAFKREKNVAYLHQMYDGKITVIPMNWPYFDWIDTYAPAGAINANILDMAKWAEFQMGNGMWHGKRLITQSNMAFMHTPQTLTNFPEKVFGYKVYYAQGWVVDHSSPYPIVWHTGGTSGASTIIAIIPKAKLGIVILTNLAGTNYALAMTHQFFDRVFHKPYKDWNKVFLKKHAKQLKKERKLLVRSEIVSPALPLKKYVGEYTNIVYGLATVEIRNHHLVITLGPKDMQLTLQHWNRDTFKVDWTENDKIIPGPTTEAAFATFRIHAIGSADQLTIDALNDDGLGVFEKVNGL